MITKLIVLHNCFSEAHSEGIMNDNSKLIVKLSGQKGLNELRIIETLFSHKQ